MLPAEDLNLSKWNREGVPFSINQDQSRAKWANFGAEFVSGLSCLGQISGSLDSWVGSFNPELNVVSNQNVALLLVSQR